MSALHVRTLFRQWAQDAAASTGFAFYDTINVEANPGDAVWWTCAFEATSTEGTFCQPGYIESGFITVFVLARPGTGDAGAVAAMEAIVPRLMSYFDPSEKMSIHKYDPVFEGSNGDATADYRIGVDLSYAYSL